MGKRLCIVILIFALALGVSAQEFTVKPLRATNEITASQYPRLDANNQPCALLKVEVVDAITEVEGGVIGSIVNKGTEKWVYFEGGQKMFKIHFANHLPVTINYNDGLQANNTYVLTLVETEVSAMTQMQSLTINYIPKDAKVSLNGTLMENAKDGNLVMTLPVGLYRYSITDGQKKYTDVVRLIASSPQKIMIDLTKVQSEEELMFEKALKYIKEGNGKDAEILGIEGIKKEYDKGYSIIDILIKSGFYDDDPESKKRMTNLIGPWTLKKSVPEFGLG